jgi:hypothetical protein
MADPIVGIVNGVPTSGTGNITTLGQTLVDGANATIGITTGAAVTTNVAGTLQQYLRGIVSLLAGTLTVATHAVTQSGAWVLSAGSAIIGNVGIDQTTPGTTNGVAINAALPAGTNAIGSVTISNANVNGQAVMASSAPVVIASNQSAVPVTSVTATANGATASRVNAAASTNGTSLKASAGQMYTLDVFNNAAYNVFLKLYNKASAPTVGTDTPIATFPIQAGGGFSKTWPMGLTFATGIAYAITKLQADTDTTVLVAGDLTGNTTWI